MQKNVVQQPADQPHNAAFSVLRMPNLVALSPQLTGSFN